MDRRNWFRLVSLAGGSLALSSFTNSSLLTEFHHPLDDGSNSLARLCYNENPYGPSEKARKAIVDAFPISHMYPFAFTDEFAHKLAKKLGVTREHIVLTAGSREGLNSVALSFAEPGGNIVAPYPTYQAMMTYGKQLGMHVSNVPLDKDFNHDLEAMEKRVTSKTSIVFICNPNNPTGNIIQKDELRSFCKSIMDRTIAFVDEAYIDYVTEDGYSSMIDLVKEDYNLVVSRTFSKIYGLAGIRMGYLVARPDIAARIRNNLMAQPNVLGIKAAEVAVNDEEFYKFSFKKNEESKKIIFSVLDDLGLEYKPSNTNFIFFHSGMDIVKLNQKMKDHGVLVGRPFPPLLDWCRISTGKTEDVEKFADKLKKVYS